MDLDAAAWARLRDNAVQITEGEGGEKCVGNGTVIRVVEDIIIILTSGQMLKKYFINGDLDISVRFADESDDRQFEGVSNFEHGGIILSNAEDAASGVGILYIIAPSNRIGVTFRDLGNPILEGTKIFMCPNTYGLARFSQVQGNISSRRATNNMERYPRLDAYIEYAVPIGNHCSSCGIYNGFGHLIGIHDHEYMIDVHGTGFSYAGSISRGIDIKNVISVIKRVCLTTSPDGVTENWDHNTDVYTMLAALGQELMNQNV